VTGCVRGRAGIAAAVFARKGRPDPGTAQDRFPCPYPCAPSRGTSRTPAPKVLNHILWGNGERVRDVPSSPPQVCVRPGACGGVPGSRRLFSRAKVAPTPARRKTASPARIPVRRAGDVAHTPKILHHTLLGGGECARRSRHAPAGSCPTGCVRGRAGIAAAVCARKGCLDPGTAQDRFPCPHLCAPSRGRRAHTLKILNHTLLGNGERVCDVPSSPRQVRVRPGACGGVPGSRLPFARAKVAPTPARRKTASPARIPVRRAGDVARAPNSAPHPFGGVASVRDVPGTPRQVRVRPGSCGGVPGSRLPFAREKVAPTPARRKTASPARIPVRRAGDVARAHTKIPNTPAWLLLSAFLRGIHTPPADNAGT
jgi:hypothetical protein